ncbi:hypothetical protein [Bacillus paralicheniformis]|uniref:hypothetical protein n=1 Tax=Bacillus paralicheniformis TaxID=1648923 RepID=UPI001D04D19D|nr:hypothetical protein [Bacillus paralicheniformis]
MKKIVNWIKHPSLSKRLAVSFLLILTLSVLILSGVSYYTAESSIEDEIMRSAKNSVDQLNEMIDQNIDKKADAITYFSEVIKEKAYTEKGQTSLRQNKDVEAVFTRYLPQGILF